MTEPLSVVAKGLAPLVGAVRGPVRRLRAERRAADDGSGGPVDLMRGLLLETLRRLQGGHVDDAWWHEILDRVGQKYVAPDFLKMPTLQEWLHIEAVEEGVVAMAKAYVMGTTDDGEPDIRKRLRACYADVTGEAEHRAEGPIDVVVAVLTAGYVAAIPHDQQPTAGMIQQVDEGVRRANAKLDDLGTRRDPLVQSVHAERVEKELSDILAQRMFETETAIRRVLKLRRQVEDGGELIGATEAVKNRVRYWAARLCAGNAETLEQARGDSIRFIQWPDCRKSFGSRRVDRRDCWRPRPCLAARPRYRRAGCAYGVVQPAFAFRWRDGGTDVVRRNRRG